MLLAAPVAVCGAKQAGPGSAPEESSEIKMTNPAVKNGLELHVGGRKIVIAPGSIEINKKVVEIPRATMVQVPPAGMLVVNEQPIVFPPPEDAAKPSKLLLPHCKASVKDPSILRKVLVSGSVKLKSTKGERAPEFREGTDYTLDIITGNITLTTNSTIKPGETIYADYSCWRRRLDTIAINQSGEFLLVQGIPARSGPEPPRLDDGLIPLANVYSEWGEGALRAIDVLPITSILPPQMALETYQRNRRALSPIVAKMLAGKPVKIAFWGDNVCLGFDARSKQAAFAFAVITRLRELFPKSQITAANCAQLNNTSSVRIANVDTDVLQAKPDLIVVSFLADIGLPAGSLENNYSILREKAEKAGCRLLVVTPHFPAPRYARASSWQTLPDKAYFTVLRDLAVNTTFTGLADVALRWEHLRSEGLRPDFMLVNDLCYPNDKGHAMYTEEILKALGIDPVDGQPLERPPAPKAVEPVFEPPKEQEKEEAQ